MRSYLKYICLLGVNIKTQNKDSLEDAVSNSPDPSKQEKGLEKSLCRWDDREGKGMYMYRDIRRG